MTIPINVDRNFIQQMSVLREMVKNRVKTGLTAQEHLDGIKISHNDFIHLVNLASKTVYNQENQGE